MRISHFGKRAPQLQPEGGGKLSGEGSKEKADGTNIFSVFSAWSEVLTHHETFCLVCQAVQQGRLLLGSVLSQGLFALPLVLFLLPCALRLKRKQIFLAWVVTFFIHSQRLGQQLANLWPLRTASNSQLFFANRDSFAFRPIDLQCYILSLNATMGRIKKINSIICIEESGTPLLVHLISSCLWSHPNEPLCWSKRSCTASMTLWCSSSICSGVGLLHCATWMGSPMTIVMGCW